MLYFTDLFHTIIRRNRNELSMCSISGFYNVHGRYLETPGHFRDILSAMNAKQKHRGPDDEDRKSTRLNSSHLARSRMPSSA